MKTKLIKAEVYKSEKKVNVLRESLRDKHKHLFNPRNPKCREFQKKWREVSKQYREDYDLSVFEHDEYIGENGLYKAVRKGNEYALEYAVCFIEVRPYFFRSGYMYVRLLRYLKNAPLSESQRERYLVVNTKYQELLRKYREKRGW